MKDAALLTDGESLKPCPFCGGSVELELCNDAHGLPGFHIECTHCNFRLFQRPLHEGSHTVQARLRERWNTRAPTASGCALEVVQSLRSYKAGEVSPHSDVYLVADMRATVAKVLK